MLCLHPSSAAVDPLMKQATFYLLDNAEPSGALSAHEASGLRRCRQRLPFRQAGADRLREPEQAQQLDEALWQREPHNSCRTIWPAKGRTTARRWNCAGPASAAMPRAIC